MTLACLVVCFNLQMLSTLSICISLLFSIHNGCPFLLSPKLKLEIYCNYFGRSYPIWSINVHRVLNGLSKYSNVRFCKNQVCL